MRLKTQFLSLIICGATSLIQAQYGNDNYNVSGLFLGITTPTLHTQDLLIKSGKGLTGGYVSRGEIYNNFDMEYGVIFFQNELMVQGQENNTPKDVTMELSGAQIKLLLGYNIIRRHLSIDMGPVLSVNSPWKAQQKEQESLVIGGYKGLKIEDLSSVSPVHGHLSVGLTGGFEHLRLSAQYQYGLTNFLGRLNKTNLERPSGGFSGQLAWTTLGAYFYF